MKKYVFFKIIAIFLSVSLFVETAVYSLDGGALRVPLNMPPQRFEEGRDTDNIGNGEEKQGSSGITRREFLKGVTGLAVGASLIDSLFGAVRNILAWEGEKVVGKDIAGTVVGPFGDVGEGTQRIFGEDGSIGFKLVVPERGRWGSYGINFDAPLDVREARLILKVKANRNGVKLQVNFRDQNWQNQGKFGEVQAKKIVELTDTLQEVKIDLEQIIGRNNINLEQLVHIAFEFVLTDLNNMPGDTIIIDQIKFSKATQEPVEPPQHQEPVKRQGVVLANKNLYVDGQPYPILGVTIERDNFTIDDIRLLDELNVNIVRTYYPITDTKILDALYEKGIRVIMGIPWDDRIGPHISDGSYKEYIEEFKNHPAILYWELGNEYNLLFRLHPEWLTLDKWWDGLKESVSEIHKIDPNHPVGTTLLIYDYALEENDIKKVEAQGIDIIGINVYSWDDPQPIIDIVKTQARVPIYFSETGADSFDIWQGRENQSAHKEAILRIWEVIDKNLRVRGPNNNVLGVTFMSLKDNWEKTGDPNIQDIGGYADTGVPPDNFSNEDWWGFFTQDGRPKEIVDEFKEIFRELMEELSFDPFPWDVNRDGVVDIFDLVLTARNFSQTGEGLVGDVNGDAIVDIKDLIELAQHFGQRLNLAPSAARRLSRKDLERVLEEIPPENRQEVERALSKYVGTYESAFLLNPYPNPASSEVNIPYNVPSGGMLYIEIYDATGRLVNSFEKDIDRAGFGKSNWDLRNQYGEKVADGIYFIKAVFEGDEGILLNDVKKIAVIRTRERKHSMGNSIKVESILVSI